MVISLLIFAFVMSLIKEFAEKAISNSKADQILDEKSEQAYKEPDML